MLLLVIFGLSACNVINPEEAVPAFLKIEAIDLETDYSVYGTDSHKITEAWVFADGDRLGSFELPATIPVLASGQTDIQVRAGIKKNGISDTRDIYPFYAGYNTSENLNAGETISLNPTVTYQDEAILLLYRDFENNIGFEGKDDISFVDISSNASEVFEGSKCMKVRTNTSKPTFQIGTNDQYFLEATSLIEGYLEMDYRNTGVFSVYVTAYFGGDVVSIDLINVNPREEWNKIYVDLTRPIKELNADAYEFGFRSAGLPEGEDEAIFLWDNVKLIVTSL